MQEGPGAAAGGRAPEEISTSFAGANRSRFEGLRSPALSAPLPPVRGGLGPGPKLLAKLF